MCTMITIYHKCNCPYDARMKLCSLWYKREDCPYEHISVYLKLCCNDCIPHLDLGEPECGLLTC